MSVINGVLTLGKNNKDILKDSITKLETFLVDNCITGISISDCNLSPQFIGILTKFINDNNIKEISLVNCDLNNFSANILFSNLSTNVTIIDLAKNNLGDGSVESIITYLTGNNLLKSLYLCRNKIGDNGTVMLSNFLKSNTTLINLSLQANKIKLVGGIAISEMLAINNTLQHLNLNMNTIGDEGISKITDALKINKTLNFLAISNLTMLSVDNIINMLSVNKTIKSLDIVESCFSEEQCLKLANTIIAADTLIELELRANSLNIESILALQDIFSKHCKLEKICLIEEMFTSRDSKVSNITPIVEKLSENASLKHLELTLCNKTQVTQIVKSVAQNNKIHTLKLASQDFIHNQNELATILENNYTITNMTVDARPRCNGNLHALLERNICLKNESRFKVQKPVNFS